MVNRSYDLGTLNSFFWERNLPCVFIASIGTLAYFLCGNYIAALKLDSRLYSLLGFVFLNRFGKRLSLWIDSMEPD
jgi:hypothetical protein